MMLSKSQSSPTHIFTVMKYAYFNMVNMYPVSKLCNLPMVGIVVTISPSFSLYRIVVFPAASKPTINILISFLLNKAERLPKSLAMVPPILIYSAKQSEHCHFLNKQANTNNTKAALFNMNELSISTF